MSNSGGGIKRLRNRHAGLGSLCKTGNPLRDHVQFQILLALKEVKFIILSQSAQDPQLSLCSHRFPGNGVRKMAMGEEGCFM